MSRWLLLAFLLLGSAAHAHKPSDSYLALRVDGAQIQGQWDIALRDLDYAIGLDANDDGEITWGELRAQHEAIAAYALSRLKIQVGGANCPTQATGHQVDDHSDGAYAVLRFAADCGSAAQSVSVEYALFFDLDSQHKGLLRLEHPGGTVTGIFGPDKAKQEFTLREVSRLRQFFDYGAEGVWHIWIGFDHILFLLSLLFPAVLAFRNRGWRPVDRFKPAFWDVFRIVTAFTVAHSITLSLAALGFVSIPSRIVESAIAASVLLAAVNNVFPVVMAGRWMVAFGFGLVHGFGFASVLADLGLPQGALLVALVGFNVGVEVGQLAIVSAFLPFAFGVRGTWFYRRMILVGGSCLIAALAFVWLLERMLDLKLITV